MIGIRRGMFRYLVLRALEEGPSHGYGVMKRISGMIGGYYTPSPGVVYPTLQMLEDMGLVESRLEGGRRVYSLTQRGREALDSRRQEVEDLLSVARGMAGLVRDLGGEELLREIRQLASKVPRMTMEKKMRLKRAISNFLKELSDILGE